MKCAEPIAAGLLTVHSDFPVVPSVSVAGPLCFVAKIKSTTVDPTDGGPFLATDEGDAIVTDDGQVIVPD